jgi:hypothetical protein
MTVRTSRKTVTFTRPFALSGIDEVQAAGTYTVETDEQLLPGLSFPAYRRIATLIFLPSRPGGAFVEQVVNIDPLDLEAAQERDAAGNVGHRLDDEAPAVSIDEFLRPAHPPGAERVRRAGAGTGRSNGVSSPA